MLGSIENKNSWSFKSVKISEVIKNVIFLSFLNKEWPYKTCFGASVDWEDAKERKDLYNKYFSTVMAVGRGLVRLLMYLLQGR